jgi:hypothetical protein
LLVAAIRMAAQIMSRPDGVPRRASFLQLRGELLTAVADYDDSGDVLQGPYRLADFPDVELAKTTGEVHLIEWAARESMSPHAADLITRLRIKSSALVPVVSDDSVIGDCGERARR